MPATDNLIDNRYEIREEMLKCRFSTCYRGWDNTRNAPCIIKKLNDKLPVQTDRQETACREQLIDEGNMLSKVNQRNLPHVTAVIEKPETVYLIMEDFEGITLDLYLSMRGETLDENTIRRMTFQMVEALRTLHGQSPPVIIGGLRPESIIINTKGHIKIVEFSLSNIYLRPFSSPHFAPPEQLMGGLPDPRNDIYSLGAVLYFLATGEVPRDAMMRLKDPAGDLRIVTKNRRITDEMDSLILKMMSPDMFKRYGSISEVEMEFAERFPVNPDTTFTIPNLMQHLSQADAPGKVDLEATITPFSAGGAVNFFKQKELLNAEPTREEAEEIDPDLNLHAIGDEGEDQKKAFGIGDLMNNLQLFKQKESVRVAPEFTMPGETFLMKYPSIDLTQVAIDRDTARVLPERISKAIQGIVVEKSEGNEIKVAVRDPSQVYIYDHIAFATEGKFRPLLYRADPNMIALAIEYVYELPAGTQGVPWYEWLEKKKYEVEDLEVKQDARQIEIYDKEEIDGPIIEATNKIIKEAISINASDIHLETFEKEMIVRYRIDGVLHIMNRFSDDMARAVIKRMKIIANMDIAQERVTQGGRISVKVRDREFDLRVSVIPVPHGESVVMRLLNKGSFDFELADLGFGEQEIVTYRELLGKPHGMILVSGPTGSGKSTTLYASLKEINRPDRKLLTVEDPIEYEMPGICQVQVNLAPREEEKKVTFAKALREFLRQDPDVILVGEIRDDETAGIAVQASLTGHLLLSTIHTNDSIDIVTRLRDMGVAPYLIGSTLNGGLAQRLVRKICTNCRIEVPVSAADKALFESHGVEIKTLFKGRGCQKCHDYGNKGRLAIYEIFKVVPELSELISIGANTSEIKKAALKLGMKPLIIDALSKAARGLITVDEVHRVTMG